MMVTYLKLMVSIMHQKIRDKIPNTLAWVIARWAVKKSLSEGVQGAGSDIPKYDAERSQGNDG